MLILFYLFIYYYYLLIVIRKNQSKENNEQEKNKIEAAALEISNLNFRLRRAEIDHSESQIALKTASNQLELCEKQETFLHLTLTSKSERMKYLEEHLLNIIPASSLPNRDERHHKAIHVEIGEVKAKRNETFHLITSLSDQMKKSFGELQSTNLKNQKTLSKLFKCITESAATRVSRRTHFSTYFKSIYSLYERCLAQRSSFELSFEFMKEHYVSGMFHPPSQSPELIDLSNKFNALQVVHQKVEESAKTQAKKIDGLEKQLQSEKMINAELQKNLQLQHQLQSKKAAQSQLHFDEMNANLVSQLQLLQLQVTDLQSKLDDALRSPSPSSSTPSSSSSSQSQSSGNDGNEGGEDKRSAGQLSENRYQRFMKEVAYLESQLFEEKERTKTLENELQQKNIQLHSLHADREKLHFLIKSSSPSADHHSLLSPQSIESSTLLSSSPSSSSSSSIESLVDINIMLNKKQEEITTLTEKYHLLENELALTKKETAKYKDLSALLEEEVNEAHEAVTVERNKNLNFISTISELEDKLRSSPIGSFLYHFIIYIYYFIHL